MSSAVYQAACNLGHAPRIFDDYRSMLDEQKPDIAVVDCFFGYHAEVIKRGTQTGIHVFVDKPVAITFEELEELKEIYSKSDVYLAAMFGIRYSAHFMTAWRMVKEGVVGQIRLMNAQKSYKLGRRSGFYKSRSTYGGTIPWVGSHAIDWLYWFSGENLYRYMRPILPDITRIMENLKFQLCVILRCRMRYLAPSALIICVPEEAPTHGDDRLRIVGTRGILEVRNGKVFLINDEIDGIREVPLLSEQNIFLDFLKQVRRTRELPGQCRGFFLCNRGLPESQTVCRREKGDMVLNAVMPAKS